MALFSHVGCFHSSAQMSVHWPRGEIKLSIWIRCAANDSLIVGVEVIDEKYPVCTCDSYLIYLRLCFSCQNLGLNLLLLSLASCRPPAVCWLCFAELSEGILAAGLWAMAPLSEENSSISGLANYVWVFQRCKSLIRRWERQTGRHLLQSAGDVVVAHQPGQALARP